MRGLHATGESDIIGRMEKPGIVTAIPKRRYRFGEFTVVVLGEVESDDDREYRYIMAVVRGSDPEPGLYITAEQAGGADVRSADYTMRIVMRDGSEALGSSREWGDLEAFAGAGLDIVGKVLQLQDEVPYRLM
jgi:hypothetical protein